MDISHIIRPTILRALNVFRVLMTLFGKITSLFYNKIHYNIFTFSRGSIVATYVATVDPASNETASSMQAVIQEELTMDNDRTFLGQLQLSGTRQTAVTYQGKPITLNAGYRNIVKHNNNRYSEDR